MLLISFMGWEEGWFMKEGGGGVEEVMDRGGDG